MNKTLVLCKHFHLNNFTILANDPFLDLTLPYLVGLKCKKLTDNLETDLPLWHFSPVGLFVMEQVAVIAFLLGCI